VDAAFVEAHIPVKNRYVGDLLVWQSGVTTRVAKTNAEVIVFLAHIFTLSTWLGVILARLRGKKTAFWGHGLYGGENRIKKLVTCLFLRLANHNFVYGEHGAHNMIIQGIPANNIDVVYNSFHYFRQLEFRVKNTAENYLDRVSMFSRPDLPLLLFVGRLTEEKKIDNLISAVSELNKDGSRYNLLIIGDGPMRNKLESLAKDNSSIYFFGPCYNENVLFSLITSSDLCVSPGNVGLTAIHVMGYGIPVCTHSDWTCQMPEAESVQDGETGVLFDPGSESLANAIERWFLLNPSREIVQRRCWEIIDRFYNPTAQLRIFENALIALTAR